jgi:integrase
MLFANYFEQWAKTYKKGTVRPVTWQKYEIAMKHLYEIAPDIEVADIDRAAYQNLINEFAKDHQHVTCMGMHHMWHAALLDALDEGLITHDPGRRIKIVGVQPERTTKKFLEADEAKLLIGDLVTKGTLSWDYFILLVLNTGLRFAEALGLTPEDFDFEQLTVRVDHTWDYKAKSGKMLDKFIPTKNTFSVRTISLDLKTAFKLRPVIEGIPEGMPIWPYWYGKLKGTGDDVRIFNSTINYVLAQHCENSGVPVIHVHGLRHTHASLLIANGVSIQAVAKRLGHANTTTTQKVYIHLLKEAEQQANEKISSVLVNM